MHLQRALMYKVKPLRSREAKSKLFGQNTPDSRHPKACSPPQASSKTAACPSPPLLVRPPPGAGARYEAVDWRNVKSEL